MTGHLLVLALVALAVWLVRAWLFPYAPCWRCGGSGKNAGSTRRRYGTCRRCDGSGRRMVRGAQAVHQARQRARSRKGRP